MAKDQTITRELAQAQEDSAAELVHTDKLVFSVYTENRPNLAELVSRYFDGATIYDATGIWQGQTEPSAVIEIVADRSRMQDVFFLAGDIKHVNQQTAVLVDWRDSHGQMV